MFKLYKGDCLEVMKAIPNESIDLILCDLPYGTTGCKWDEIIPFDQLWKHYNRIIKNNGAIVLFSAQPFTTKLIHSNLKHFKYCWYWRKNNVTGFTFAKYQPMRCIEDICVFYKRQPKYNPQGLIAIENPKTRIKKNMKDSVYKGATLTKPYTPKYTNYPKNILEYKNEAANNKNRLHPTQKPVALLEHLIKTYTDEGEVVLDNCMGSGSTGIACINTGRKFIGIEMDDGYFNVAQKRLNSHIAAGDQIAA